VPETYPKPADGERIEVILGISGSYGRIWPVETVTAQAGELVWTERALGPADDRGFADDLQLVLRGVLLVLGGHAHESRSTGSLRRRLCSQF